MDLIIGVMKLNKEIFFVSRMHIRHDVLSAMEVYEFNSIESIRNMIYYLVS